MHPSPLTQKIRIYTVENHPRQREEIIIFQAADIAMIYQNLQAVVTVHVFIFLDSCDTSKLDFNVSCFLPLLVEN